MKFCELRPGDIWIETLRGHWLVLEVRKYNESDESSLLPGYDVFLVTYLRCFSKYLDTAIEKITYSEQRVIAVSSDLMIYRDGKRIL